MSNMDGTTSKGRLLDDLRDEQAQWEALLQDIGENHMTQPDVAGGWSIKDIVAQLDRLASPNSGLIPGGAAP